MSKVVAHHNRISKSRLATTRIFWLLRVLLVCSLNKKKHKTYSTKRCTAIFGYTLNVKSQVQVECVKLCVCVCVRHFVTWNAGSH